MADISISSGLDALTPELLMALRAKQSGPKTDTMTKAERAAVARISKKLASPKKMQAKFRKELRAKIARFQKEQLVFAPPAPKYFGPPVRCGFDAEWVTRPDGRGGFRNEVLCITAVIGCGGRKSRYIHYLEGPLRRDRPTMVEFFQQAIRSALKDGTVPSMPNEVITFGHFMRGDLASFGDFWSRKREFSGLGKTLVTGRASHVLATPDVAGGGDGRHEISDDDAGEGGQSGPLQVHLRGLDGRQFAVRVRFVDTIKLTPGQKNLAYAAKMIGRKKLDLHTDLNIPAIDTEERPECIGLGLPAHYGKDRMDLVKRDFPEQFKEYAIEDAEIALDYGVWMERMAVEQFGLRRLPNSLAGIASAVVRNLSGGSAAFAELVGRESKQASYYNEKTGTYRTVKRDVPSQGLEIYYKFATDAYHGGRNECFYHGPTDVGMWYDFDLPGAYTTALVGLRPIDYDRIYTELDPDAYGIDDMGIAWITFEFPPGTRFPCLPVQGEREALFFPLQGRKEDRVCVGAPEIFLARQMGAEITIIHGFKAPWKSDERIFEAFTHLVQTKRREFPKNDHPALNELWKEVGNSAYGLTAQGLKPKNAFDPQSMRSKKIGTSPLTEPFMAAWATSFIRAVLGEILTGLPVDGTVVTATTDGVLTNVPLERLKLDGPLCSYFAGIRERLFGAREVLELKHGARQLVSVAVRTTFTGLKAEGFDPICAKGSVKPPTRPDPAAQNRHMLKLYLRQYPGMKVENAQLISAREQLTLEADLVELKRERVLNLRYDFKRKPVRPRMVRLGRRVERIAWDTVPWQTVAEAEFARVRVDGWSRERQQVFKTMEDYIDWEGYCEASWAMKVACEAARIRTLQIRRDNAWGVLKRVFLQAGRQGRWGITFERRGVSAIAKILTEAGFPTDKDDITFAARRNARLLSHCVPWVPETVALLRVILRHFPGFQYLEAFRPIKPDDLGRLELFDLAGAHQ